MIAPATVAGARLYAGVHYPIDVLGSVLLVALWLSAVRLVVLRPQDDDG